MLASFTSMQLEPDPHSFGNPVRFNQLGKRSSGREATSLKVMLDDGRRSSGIVAGLKIAAIKGRDEAGNGVVDTIDAG